MRSRRNGDADLRELERGYASSRTLSEALRVAMARRRAGFAGAGDALAALLSNAIVLGAARPRDAGWTALELTAPVGGVMRVWRFATGWPGQYEYVLQRLDVPPFAEHIEPRWIRVVARQGQRVTQFTDVTEEVGRTIDAVPAPTSSFVTEMTRFMLSELLVRPRLGTPPFDLRRDPLAPTVQSGLMAWSSGLGDVTASTRSNVDVSVRRVIETDWRADGTDPRYVVATRTRPLVLVVRDIEQVTVTVGVRFSEVLPREPDSLWTHLRDEYNQAEDRAEIDFPDDRRAYRESLAQAVERIYVAWARTPAPDRISIHEADATAFAAESSL